MPEDQEYDTRPLHRNKIRKAASFAFHAALYIFAVAGLVLTAGYFATRFRLTNVRGAIDLNNRYFSSMAQNNGDLTRPELRAVPSRSESSRSGVSYLPWKAAPPRTPNGSSWHITKPAPLNLRFAWWKASESILRPGHRSQILFPTATQNG